MNAALVAALLSLGASVVALFTSAVAFVAVRAARRTDGAAVVQLDRIAHQLAALDQAWYWTPEWQAGEAEADADLEAGRSTLYDSDKEFFDALRMIPAADTSAQSR